MDDHPPEEVAGFLQEEYPAMTIIPECGRRLQEAGYARVGSSRLSPEARRKEYYDPLEKDGDRNGETAGQKPDAGLILDVTRRESDLFRTHSG